MLSLTDVWRVKTKIEIFIRDDLTDEHIAKLLVHQLRTALGDRYERVVNAMITEHQNSVNVTGVNSNPIISSSSQTECDANEKMLSREKNK